MVVFLVSVEYCVQRYDMPLSRGNDLHGCRRLLHECTHSSGYGGPRHSAADAPDAALRRPRGSLGLRLSLQNGGVEIMPSLPSPLMPSAAPPTASAVLPKNVRQGATSRVGVRGNGGMVLVRDVNLSSCYSSTPPSLGVRNWKVVLPSALVMRKSVRVMMSMPKSIE